MFGLLRFILALIVIFNHNPTNDIPFEMAVSSVVIFYMISGYLMGIKRTEYRKRTKFPVILFITDRFLRIYPLYFLYATLTLFAVFYLGDSRALKFNAILGDIVFNYSLIPLGFYMFFESSVLVPQAFSLALEEQFYILLPFIISYRKVIICLVIVSLIIMVVCAFGFYIGLPIIWSDWFVYRLLGGTLGIFFLGVFINDKILNESIWKKVIYGTYCMVLLMAYFLGNLRSGTIFAVGGVLVGYPIVSYLALKKRNKVDDFFGNPSFGMFLNHFLIFHLIEIFYFKNGIDIPVKHRILTTFLSISLAFLTYYLFEFPMHRFRSKVVEYFYRRFPVKES